MISIVRARATIFCMHPEQPEPENARVMAPEEYTLSLAMVYVAGAPHSQMIFALLGQDGW